VSDQLQKEILNSMDDADEQTVFRVNRFTNFCNKFIKHSGWYPDKIVRLYNRKYYQFNDAQVHESVDCKGATIKDLKGHLLHYAFNSLEAYIDKLNNYAKAWAQSQFKKGRKAGDFNIFFRTLFSFVRHYFLKLGLLDGYHGFLIAVIQMQYTS